MAISNLLATKYSALVELGAMEASIARRITGNQYQADASGTTAIKSGLVGAINIIDYTNDTDLSALQSLSDTGITINLNQKKAFNFSVDDVDAAQSAGNFANSALQQGANALGLKADSYVFGLYAGATHKIGSIGSSISVTSANVDDQVYAMKELLDTSNAGPNRWLAVPSWFMTKLSLSGLGTQLGDILKDALFTEGEVIRYAGFNIVQSNQISAKGVGLDEYQIMAFTDRAIPMVAQVQKVETLRNPNRFGDIVRGLYVFGASIAHPAEVVTLSATKGVS